MACLAKARVTFAPHPSPYPTDDPGLLRGGHPLAQEPVVSIDRGWGAT